VSFTQWVASNKAAILFALWIIGGALYRALPAEAASFNFAQFILDWVRGILGALPSQAPKLTTAQKAQVKKD
jgi:hypothetical protein